MEGIGDASTLNERGCDLYICNNPVSKIYAFDKLRLNALKGCLMPSKRFKFFSAASSGYRGETEYYSVWERLFMSKDIGWRLARGLTFFWALIVAEIAFSIFG